MLKSYNLIGSADIPAAATETWHNSSHFCAHIMGNCIYMKMSLWPDMLLYILHLQWQRKGIVKLSNLTL